MTKEELKQEAKEYAKPWKNSLAYVSIKDAYLAGAEPREKRIAELEAQIEKMKCCENCNNFQHRINHRCNTKCKNLSEWEIKEND